MSEDDFLSEGMARLVIQCADQPGIVAAVSTFLYHQNANITALDQYSTDPVQGQFFMRLEFQTTQLHQKLERIKKTFKERVASRFNMIWRIREVCQPVKAAILVSKHDHALLDLLWRHNRGELPLDIQVVISNHADLGPAVSSFNIPFQEISVCPENKTEAENTILSMLGDEVEVIILARYMQILSAAFVRRYPSKIINIHHSFLPAFVGADPYRQANDRGVKVIGATAHYVTELLDEGPIITQDVETVSHRDTVLDLKQKGRDIERRVLSNAVKWHIEDRVIVHENRTLVFS